ncbi:hypothetical protein PGH07_08735 [Sulfurovum sp. zt1-1]|uniref:Uncharacterized protein n=1 Tax=Sulfurovum zhangzhouensis TaxID=3019067 RepID=A0ABT7QZJ0_9BACT|nr:hypothetical protein [Sulfurovum zhangzhouensis]MDM5272265.1 hypothetical protein [Sulfurovum zhangzhouensis]
MKKFILTLLIISCNTYAEVSDKIPSQEGLWLSGTIVGIVLVILLRWTKWINILAIPLTAIFFYFAYDTLIEPDIGSAIIKEQGKPYVMALYGSATLVLLGVIFGNILYKKRKKSHDIF